jgi:choice-of-anchor B domain-containing protein
MPEPEKYFAMKNFFYLLLLLTPVALFAQPTEATLLGNWDDPDIPGSFFYDNAYNEIWGLTVNGREFAIIGSTLGTHFIDVTDPENPLELTDLFVEGAASGGSIIHRDYHDHNGFLYAVCDEGNSSLQVIDIRELPNSVSVVYDSNATLSKSHNIFIDAATGKLYACGVRKAGSGSFVPLQVYCLEDPANPELMADITNVGSFSLPYAHDIYVENDTAYLNCGGSGLYVVDFTDPDNPEFLGSMTDYPQSGYNHSGWMHPDGQYYYLADETHGRDIKVVDVSDLSNMEVVQTFNADSPSPFSIPHNLIVRCNKLYVSYYYDGVQVFDLSDPANPVRIAYYHTSQIDHQNSYEGLWGVYPFLESGNFLVSDMQEGLFVFESLDDGCDVAFTTEGEVSCGEPISSANEVNQAVTGFDLFPSPSPGWLNLNIQLEAPSTGLQFELHNLSGQQIQQQWMGDLPSGENQIEFFFENSIPDGMYVVHILGQGIHLTQKVILQR